MSSSTDILALYREFADELTEVLAENAVGVKMCRQRLSDSLHGFQLLKAASTA